MYYILAGHKTVPVEDVLEWGEWFGKAGVVGRRVAETTLPDGRWVSTVFLGLDHNLGFGRPKLFETMVFGSREGPLDEEGCWRYETWEEAEVGHQRVVEELMEHERVTGGDGGC